jgi:SAM-dependent methyltransferase
MKNILSIAGIFVMVMITSQNISAKDSEKIISHAKSESFDISLIKEKLESKADNVLPVDIEIKMLEELESFKLGRFLLENKGLNGYWTSYIILYAPLKSNLSTMESWLINDAPIIKATRERFYIFRRLLQQNLKSNSKIASIPCGTMDDLLGLDYRNKAGVQIVGIDLDDASLELARENARKYSNDNVEFYKKDAWNLGLTDEFDIITSNGLNIYEPDDDRVIELYKGFYNALKKDGILLSSFVTPPPSISPDSPWKNFDKNNALKQKAIFSDIIGVMWQSYRTETQTKYLLAQAGFKDIEFIYDTQNMFPTFVARK